MKIGIRGYGSRSDKGTYLNNCLRKVKMQNCEGCANREVGHYQEWEVNIQLVVSVDEALPLTRGLFHPFRPHKLLQPLPRTRRGGAITACVCRTQMERTEHNVNLPTLINVVCCTLHNFLSSTDTLAGVTGHSQEQDKKEGHYPLTRNIGGNF